MDQKINFLATEVYESVQNHLNLFQAQQIDQSNREVRTAFSFLPLPTSLDSKIKAKIINCKASEYGV